MSAEAGCFQRVSSFSIEHNLIRCNFFADDSLPIDQIVVKLKDDPTSADCDWNTRWGLGGDARDRASSYWRQKCRSAYCRVRDRTSGDESGRRFTNSARACRASGEDWTVAVVCGSWLAFVFLCFSYFTSFQVIIETIDWRLLCYRRFCLRRTERTRFVIPHWE